MTGIRRPGGGLVLACGAIELVSWGSLYYTVPVLHERISDDTGWSVQLLTLNYSLALVVAGLLGPTIGRLIDKRGPRLLVVCGSALGGAGLLVVAVAPSLAVQLAGMLVIGAAQAATLYPPIFAALTIRFGSDKAWALTVVSLFGGASSTVFAPALASLVHHLEWRSTLATVAVAYVVVSASLGWIGLREPWRGHAEPGRGTGGVDVAAISRTWRFRALQLSMMLSGVGLYASTLNLIGLTREQGFSYDFAATVFGMVGVGQVAGRLLYLPLAERGSPRDQTLLQVSSACLVVAGLGLLASNPGTLIVGAIAAGAVRGAHTLVMASGVSDRWGAVGFGALSGSFNRPIALAIAVSPFVGTSLAGLTGSYSAAALVLASTMVAGLLFARWT